MGAGSSTLANNETVTLRLGSGEMVDVIVPSGLSDESVKAYARMKRPDLFGAPTSMASMPGRPNPRSVKEMSTSPGDVALGTDIGTSLREFPNPGVSEGRGLREGLAEWDDQSFGNMGRGALDIGRGNVSRGAHEVISGGMNAMTPAAPLLAPAAPGAFVRGLAGGAGGSYLARKGAEAINLTPDQQDLAGDIGGLAGGYAGARAPEIVRPVARPVGRLLTAIGQSADPDMVGMVSPRAASALRYSQKAGRLASKIGSPSGVSLPQNPGAPYPTATSEQLNPSLVSPSRSLPGQISPEVIRPPAQPIPQRSGLALPPGPEATAPSLVEQMRASAPETQEQMLSRWAARNAATGRSATSQEPIGPETMTPQEKDIWQQSIFGHEPEKYDIGEKLRQQNPEPTRAETKGPSLLDQIREQVRQIQAQPAEDVPAGSYGRQLRIEGQDVDPNIDLRSAMAESTRRIRAAKGLPPLQD